MKTNLKQMRCGGCGHDQFKIFTSDETANVGIECQQCKSVSWVYPEPAKLKIEWGNQLDGEDSLGRLAIF